MSMTLEALPQAEPKPRAGRRRGKRRRTSLFAQGEPMLWLTGGALVVAVVMIVGLLGGVLILGMTTFWPLPVQAVRMEDGSVYMGAETRTESFRPDEFTLESLPPETRAEIEENGGRAERRLLRVGNRDLTGVTYRWLDGFRIQDVSFPEWAVVVERLTWGRFYGTPLAFEIDGETVADTPEAVWSEYLRLHGESHGRRLRIEELEKHDIGRLNLRLEKARLRARGVALAKGEDSAAWKEADARYRAVEQEVSKAFEDIAARTDELKRENARYEIVMRTADGVEQPMQLAEIVRAYPANQLDLGDKIGIYLSRWWEFLTADPRESNMEGGVFPAIVGTVTMTLVMSLLVVPFGVLAALYLREYAKQGFIISMVRIAVNNLAGVPSIVFGVFGLGFFCYIVGGWLDRTFYPEALPDPTLGKRGLIWASLTLALLTLPVVIVATEEALSAVPNSMREGSYACGATKWQTIRRIVLPRAAPGIMTGMILAIARGAGEVAPLMLVGAVKYAQYLPVDLEWPFIHPSRSFMHLGFHIFDLGFQSPDSEAAKPMVFTTTLLLIVIVVVLNLLAIWIRARLRGKHQAVHI